MRSTIVESLEMALAWVDLLRSRTDELLQSGEPISETKLISLTFGMRARNGLRAIALLHAQNLDDQVTPIARAFLEAAIDLAYLQVDTQRVVSEKKPPLPLSVAEKTRLFYDFRYIKHKQLGRHTTPPEDRYREAEQFRIAKLGGLRPSTWHGGKADTLVAELSAAAPDGALPDFADSLLYQLKQYSYGSHTNPLAQLYFENVPDPARGTISRVRDGVRDDNVLWAAVMAGALVLVRWALDMNTSSDRTAIDATFYAITQPLLDAVPNENTE